MPAQLTERKKRFSQYYISTGNATESAKLAGYSTRTAYSIGHRLLRDVEVRKILDADNKERCENLSKENFIDTAWQGVKSLDEKSSVRPRYLEIAGRALGYLKPENENTTNINLAVFNQVARELNLEPKDSSRKIIEPSLNNNHIGLENKSSEPSVAPSSNASEPSLPTHATQPDPLSPISPPTTPDTPIYKEGTPG